MQPSTIIRRSTRHCTRPTSYATVQGHLARRNSMPDLLWMADAHFYGEHGMTKNRGASYKFYQKAYDLGGRDGVAQLAFLYQVGWNTS